MSQYVTSPVVPESKAVEALPRTLVSLSHVTLRFGDGPSVVTALDDITLQVTEGERVCVLGANGSGKSTLASVICGLLAPDEGEVTLLGECVFGVNGVNFDAYRRVRRQIGLVFQNPEDQIVTSIVEEDVAFGPENLGLPPQEIEKRVTRELRRVAMTDFALADPTRLSGGQQQRVAIAGALAMEPRVLVLDEPGALLDVRGRRGIMRVIAELRALGTTVVHITHFMEEALEADRVIVLDRGRVLFDGTPAEVFAHADELEVLGLEAPFTAQLAAKLRSRVLDVPWTCDEHVLREALEALVPRATPGPLLLTPSPRAPSSSVSTPESAVTCDHVSYSYHDDDGRKALNNVSLFVGKGSSCAIVGQTGSGKSTLVRLICALEAPDQGRVVVDGIDTSRTRERRKLHGRVGFVMQHPERQLFAETVLEDVAYGPTNMGLSPADVQARCTHALNLVGLVGKEAASPFQLSGGQQRLCAIAGVLAMEPEVLVLDEPTAGLDPRGRAQINRILDDIHTHGVTVIRVTHSMEAAAQHEQVVVLSNAGLLMQGVPEEVFSPAHEQVLHDAGLGLPEPLRWAMHLSLDETPLTLEALADAIMAARGCSDGI